MFRKLWVIVARLLRPENGERTWLREIGTRMLWSPLTKRTVHFIRVCRPCRHLSVDAYQYRANEMFPVWSVWKSNRYGFNRVTYVGDCQYFRVPVPNWFGAWLRPIVTSNNTRDGWWFGNERTENWERYRGVREDWERLSEAR
jgi:hypothetical protein